MENNQQQFSSWFKSEVIAAFAIGSVVAAVVLWFMSPINSLNTQMAVIQNQIAELKSNDLTHIELSQKDTETRIDDIQKQVFDMAKTIYALAAYVKQK